jgi:hypothetical protein
MLNTIRERLGVAIDWESAPGSSESKQEDVLAAIQAAAWISAAVGAKTP